MNSMAIRTKVIAAGASLLAASLTSVLSYEVLDWLLIRYWEWRHDGREMVYTFWADIRATPLTILASLVAMIFMYRLVRRHTKLSRSG
jgi:hypothetical protein